MLFALVLILGATSTAHAYKKKTSRENMVTVEVKPMKVVPGQIAKFKISMNTHSKELNHDMVTTVVLTDNEGREYHPQKWDGSPPGGHHREGVLLFPKLHNDVKTVRLVIKNIASVPTRSFEWQIKN